MQSYNNCIRLFALYICLFFALPAMAQEIILKGNVKDKNTKEALIGANVQIKGTNFGSVTDMDGKFEIKADIALPLTLEISYLGFATQEIAVSNTTSDIVVVMEAQEIKVSDDIVISASRLSERIQTSPSSIQKLNAKQIQFSASGNFYQVSGI